MADNLADAGPTGDNANPIAARNQASLAMDQSKKTMRHFYCRDVLWETFEQMANDFDCSIDYLINEAMRYYARSKNYQSSMSPPNQRASGPPAGAPSFRKQAETNPPAATEKPVTLKATAGKLPDGIEQFNGMLVGRLAAKDVERGTFVVQVDAVSRVWRNSKAKDPKSVVGKSVEIGGVFGKFLDVLIVMRKGETIEFECKHDGDGLVLPPGSGEGRLFSRAGAARAVGFDGVGQVVDGCFTLAALRQPMEEGLGAEIDRDVRRHAETLCQTVRVRVESKIALHDAVEIEHRHLPREAVEVVAPVLTPGYVKTIVIDVIGIDDETLRILLVEVGDHGPRDLGAGCSEEVCEVLGENVALGGKAGGSRQNEGNESSNQNQVAAVRPVRISKHGFLR